MAKAKDLAALAGLAGLAYAMRNKDKGMTPEENDTLANANRVSKMSDDSDTLARVNRNMSPGQSAVDDTNAGVLNAITAPKKVEDTSNYSNEGRSAISASKPVTKSVPKNKTASKYPSGVMAPPKDPRELEAGMNRGSRYKPPTLMKKGGVVKMASGGMTASRRADGIASRGKTRGKIC